MILVKSRLIFGLIKTILGLAFKIVYKIIKWFRLIFALIVFVAGVILHYTGVLEQHSYLKILLAVLMVLALIYPIYALIRKLTKGSGKKDGEKPYGENPYGEQRLSDVEEREYNLDGQSYYNQKGSENYTQNQDYQTHQNVGDEGVRASEPTLIGYFKVKQNPNYLMAEYTDRYELFLKTDKGLKKVRVDYKTQEK